MVRGRALLFCHDGTGLGHLRRISRVAESLQSQFACVIVSGMRDASWIAPESCELITIPRWIGLTPRRDTRAGHVSLQLSQTEASAFRSKFIALSDAMFCPDLVIVDYLPFGQKNELSALLQSTRARKYFLHRGISDTSDAPVLAGEATQHIADCYDRVIVAADKRMGDVIVENCFTAAAAAKVKYVGYVAPPADPKHRVLGPAPLKIVCSAGGGRNAERLMQACISLAASFPENVFEIVLGPFSTLFAAAYPKLPSNCRLHQTARLLPQLHADADIVLTTGGYNSVLEAACGGARILAHPNQCGTDDERAKFASRLAQFYPITLVTECDELRNALDVAIAQCKACPKPTFDLDQNGGLSILNTALQDCFGPD